MRKTILILSCATALLGVNACKKKDKDKGNDGVTYKSMEEVFSKYRLKTKAFIINPTTGGSYRGNSGTRYVFQGNSFRSATAATVSGNVEVTACEYLTKSDMLFSKMAVVSGLEPLVNVGGVELIAVQNNKPVYLKPGKTFSVTIPAKGADITGMNVYAGRRNDDTSVNKVNWVQRDTASVDGISMAGDSVVIMADSLNLLTAARLTSDPTHYQRFTLTITASGTLLGPARPYAFAFFDGQNCIWPMGFSRYDNGTIDDGRVPDMPVHFVVFTLIDGKFYAGITAARPKSGQNYSVVLQHMTVEDFKAQVDKL